MLEEGREDDDRLTEGSEEWYDYLAFHGSEEVSRPLWYTRFLLIVVGVPIGFPIILFLMLLDAASAAWDELRGDWHAAVEGFKSEWRGE